MKHHHTVSIEVDEGGIALVRMDLPGRTHNVLSPEMLAGLDAVFERVGADPAIKGAVLTSAKPAGFMAGADLKDLVAAHDRGITAIEAARFTLHASEVFRRMERCGKPVAAAIGGVALGGGFELGLACHHRVLADHPRACVGLPEVTLGLLPGAGGTQRLPRMIGIEAALPVLLEGRRMLPAEALRHGLVDEVVPPEAVVARSRAWVLDHPGAAQPWDVEGFAIPGGAGPLAPHAGRSFTDTASRLKAASPHDPAPAAILSAVYEGTLLPFDRALRLEAKYFGTLLSGPVARNLIRTMFINKRRADRLERRPSGDRHPVERLGVLGAGMMGAGIAQVAAAVGIDVVLLDRTPEDAARGKHKVQAALERERDRGRLPPEAAATQIARIETTGDAESMASCDLIIEAVFEDRAIKMDVLRAGEAAMPAGCLLASNTSTLSITSLGEDLARPDNFIGLHFFSPVPRMPLVEIILGARTSPASLARALDLVGQLGKTPIVVQDSPGFYTSRIFCAYVDEAMAMLQEGVAPALIENAARQAGMAAPPLAVTDEVSLDLQKAVADQAVRDGVDARFRRLHARPVIDQMNAMGRLGRKRGAGFYDYPADGAKRLWPGLAELYPRAERQPTAAEVGDRLLYIQALESARCVEEGVITEAADADLGSILGLGFPKWTGGALSLIDTVGLPAFLAACRRLAADHGARFQPSPWLAQRAAEGVRFHPPIEANP